MLQTTHVGIIMLPEVAHSAPPCYTGNSCIRGTELCAMVLHEDKLKASEYSPLRDAPRRRNLLSSPGRCQLAPILHAYQKTCWSTPKHLHSNRGHCLLHSPQSRYKSGQHTVPRKASINSRYWMPVTETDIGSAVVTNLIGVQEEPQLGLGRNPATLRPSIGVQIIIRCLHWPIFANGEGNRTVKGAYLQIP
jgi:hypothetical protein